MQAVRKLTACRPLNIAKPAASSAAMDRVPGKADSSVSSSTSELTIRDTTKKQSLIQLLTLGTLPETAIAWSLITQNYNSPEILLQTQYEKRILVHVLLGKDLKF